MIDFRPVLLVNGILLATLALAMLFPAFADALEGNPEWSVFMTAAVVSLFVGGALYFVNRGAPQRLTVRQAFLLTTSSWFFISAVAALPFFFAHRDLSYADAFFESVSGLTTTGATVMTGLDQASPGILLWRAILHWLGGIGIVVTAIALLPLLQIGGMQLFRTEKGAEQAEKILPRTAQIAGALGAIYVILTVLNTIGYWAAGMTFFEAVCHAMATISTGGFSTSDASIAHFHSLAIEIVAMVFMILGSLSFVVFLQVARGKLGAVWLDTQIRWFLAVIAVAILAIAGWNWLAAGQPPGEALRQASFSVISVISTTGFTSVDFARWGSFPIAVLFFLMAVGGCTGSTAGGIKVFRFQVLYATARVQLLQLIQPHGVFTPHFNRRPIPEGVTASVMGFFFLYALSFGALALALQLFGLDFLTGMSGAAAALGNVGPGLSEMIGPSGNYKALPEGAKWLLSFGMLLGRLELFTILVLFVPSFWRD